MLDRRYGEASPKPIGLAVVLLGVALWTRRRGATIQIQPTIRSRAAADRERTPSAPQRDHHGGKALHDEARGREADTPTKIPARGWKDIALRVYNEIGDDRVLAIAAGVTFYGLLALFPAIGALVSLYGLLADPATINEHLAALSQVLPGGAIQVVGDQVKRVASAGETKLGLAFAAGLAVALWSANGGIKAIFDALNVVYDETEKRGFVRLNATSLVFTVGAVVFGLVVLGAMVGLPIVLEHIWFGSTIEWLLSIVRGRFILAAVVLALALLYRFGPVGTRLAGAGSHPVAFLPLCSGSSPRCCSRGTRAISGSYNETYGSLGAVVGLMMWMWISTIVVLLGAELNAEAEHQTARDTTEGHPKPMGSRGAKMADEVAPAAR